MNSTKIIAMYLPQFHAIPENDEFWGTGFTDWVSVKKAKPLFKGHRQPKIPLDENYYDLSTENDVRWQTRLAKKYGIYGFGIYHYWFNNEKNILTKPAEIIRDNEDIDTHYFFAWDNGSWKRSWSNVKGNNWSPLAEENVSKKGPSILIPYILGTEPDWENHFDYLLSFFKDERYIKIDGKPVFVIYNYSKDILPMVAYWDKLAQQNGFPGVFVIYRYDELNPCPQDANMYYYQPLAAAGWQKKYTVSKMYYKVMDLFHFDVLKSYDYDAIWKCLLETASKKKEINVFHGAFVSYDDTPRRGIKGKIIKGASPEKFSKYLKKLLDICKSQNKEFLFLTAWNEWSEGAYLEPDSDFRYDYLEALKNAIEKL